MKIEKDFAPVTIKIETREEWEHLVDILKWTASGSEYIVREHAYNLLKMLKEA